MVNIAKQYTDPGTQQKYLSACERFRYPYWDPCIPRKTSTQSQFGIPVIVSRPKVFVKWPKSPNDLTEVDNPLFSFKFPESVQPRNNQDFLWGQNSNVSLATH